MTEQDYKEKRAAVQQSGMPLDIQKYMLTLLDRDFKTQRIPCSERLPEQHIDVLAEFGDGDYVIAWYSKVNNWWINSSTGKVIKSDVIAWRQLPEPYKESCTGATREEEIPNGKQEQ